MTTATEERADWLAWRRGGIGASDVAGVLGLSPWASPWSIYISKVGIITPTDDEPSDSMRLGTDLEPVIAAWFERATGLHVVGEQTWLTHPALDWPRATVDGFVTESDSSAIGDALGIFEAKYSADAPWERPPDHYLMQVQWQLFVSGLGHAWLACLHMAFGRPAFRVYVVERDDAVIAQLMSTCERFWNEHVMLAVPPPPDGSQATLDAIAATYPTSVPDTGVELPADAALALVVLDALHEQADDIDRRLKAAEAELKVALGDAEIGTVDGVKRISWKSQDRRGVDLVALRAEQPEIAEKYTTTSSSRVLRRHKPKGST